MATTLDRTKAPEISLPDQIHLPEVPCITLDNGLRVFLLNEGGQDVVKIDFAFEAGKWPEEKNLTAEITGRMIREGVESRSALEIAEQLEFYGCSLESGVSFTHSNFQLYSVNKYLQEALPLMMELFTQATFPENELQTLLTNRKQKLNERLAKSEFVANRSFVTALWGNSHPYGRITKHEDLDRLTREDLQNFYRKYYSPRKAFAILSGKFSPKQENDFCKVFGDKAWNADGASEVKAHIASTLPEKKIHIEKADAVQTAIQIGNVTINKYHQDYDQLSILNTLFGGYFSSRLMANIREDKGFTYGIYSSLFSFQHGGQFEIAAEVGKESAAQTFGEIEKEISRLHNEPVKADELQTVKNYMVGKILRSIDGPMKYSEVLKSLIQYGRDGEYLNDFLKTIDTTTAEDMMALAKKYLKFEEMVKVSVG